MTGSVFLCVSVWVLLIWVPVCQKIRDLSWAPESPGWVPEKQQEGWGTRTRTHNSFLVPGSLKDWLFSADLILDHTKTAHLSSSKMMCHMEQMGFFLFLNIFIFFGGGELKKIKGELRSPNHSCRLICPLKQMVGWILQALLYINEQQWFIFDLWMEASITLNALPAASSRHLCSTWHFSRTLLVWFHILPLVMGVLQNMYLIYPWISIIGGLCPRWISSHRSGQ